jgi:sulfoxide reductase heme-binding subunit YedZ
MTGPDPREYGWWLASRASGLVALALITASVVLGLLAAGKVVRGPGIARRITGAHEEVALAGLVGIAVHMITLLGDRWLDPGFKGVLVPFQLDHARVFTGFGVIAAYLAAALGLSFYARRRIGARLWRKLHRLTIVVYVLALVHVIGAGTDAGTTWLQVGLAATAGPVALLFALRVHESRQRPESPAKRPPVPRPSEASPRSITPRPSSQPAEQEAA